MSEPSTSVVADNEVAASPAQEAPDNLTRFHEIRNAALKIARKIQDNQVYIDLFEGDETAPPEMMAALYEVDRSLRAQGLKLGVFFT